MVLLGLFSFTERQKKRRRDDVGAVDLPERSVGRSCDTN